MNTDFHFHSNEVDSSPRFGDEPRRGAWFDDIIRDLRYSFRSLLRSRGFAFGAIVSLALGIGLNTFVVSLFESLLLKPLPIQNPEQVSFVETKTSVAHSFPNYLDFRDQSSSFNALAGYRMAPMDVETNGQPKRAWGYLATGNYFDLLGVKPALGRFFHHADDLKVGASPYAVFSYESWQARFGSDSSIVGKSVHINGRAYTVIGIAPKGFHGTELFYWPELWVPMTMEPQIEVGNPWLTDRHTWNTWIIGRLTSGVSRQQAAADLSRIARDLEHRFPGTNQSVAIRLSPVGLAGSSLRKPVRLFVGGLLLLVALVLLTCCVNVAGLMSARGSDRQREIAVRSSLGAGRGRVVRQLLTESAFLSSVGGLGGFVLAASVCRLISHWHVPIDIPVQLDVTPDLRVFFATAVISMLTGILFGLEPALKLSRTDVSGLLKGGTRPSVLRRRFRIAFRDLLVTIEVAMCFVLVFASFLSIHGLQNALNLSLGLNPSGVTTATVDLGLSGYDEARGRAFQKHLLETLTNSPSTSSAAYASSLPLSMDQSTTAVQNQDELTRTPNHAISYQVSPGFFLTLQIHLLRGRDFNYHDNSDSPEVAIVNQTFSERIMHTVDPIGKTFRRGFDGARVQVIGLVEDGKYTNLTESPRPAVFWPVTQRYTSTTTLVVRSHLESVEVLQLIREAVAAMNKDLPMYGTGTLQNMLAVALLPMRAAAITLSAFGLLALVLAITGIQGLLAYAVSQRVREIGIRIAIGAQRSNVLRFLFSRLITLVIIGLGIGFVLSMAAGSVLGSVVYGVSPKDPMLLLTVFTFLFIVAILSCGRPVLRALSITPVNALRYQ